MLSFPFCYLQMASPNKNREDRANKEDLNISAQIQGAQVMVSIRVNIQQHVTKQASFPRSNNPDNCNNHVVVLQTTAGWRKAPASAQRVCTRGLASLRSISLKNTMNTTGFRVVRAAGA